MNILIALLIFTIAFLMLTHDEKHDLDIWINEKIFRGAPGETISSRLGRRILRGDCWLCRRFCRLLDLIFKRKKHCQHAAEKVK
jgi:hypothetical protein